MDAMDNLLDGTLDDLSDMPEFKPYPAGVHKCYISFESKEINKFPAVEVSLKAIETVELSAGDSEGPLAEGAVTSSAFFLKHSNSEVAKLGQGKLKEILKALQPSYPSAVSMRELMKEASGSVVMVATGQRPNKEKTKMYTDILMVTPS